MRTCQYRECNIKFEPNTHNQVYHSNECCNKETSERIMEKYYKDKRIENGEYRVCDGQGCQTVLSRYNKSPYCSKCTRNKSKQTRSFSEVSMA